MLNFMAGAILGLIIGGAVVYFFILMAKKSDTKVPPVKEDTNFNPNVEIKRENMAKLENLISQKQTGDKITNDEVQSLLKVSDATAERYLDDLEKKGLLKQVGAVGQEVHYLKV